MLCPLSGHLLLRVCKYKSALFFLKDYSSFHCKVMLYIGLAKKFIRVRRYIRARMNFLTNPVLLIGRHFDCFPFFFCFLFQITAVSSHESFWTGVNISSG